MKKIILLAITVFPLFANAQSISENFLKKPNSLAFVVNANSNFSAAVKNEKSIFNEKTLTNSSIKNNFSDQNYLAGDSQIFVKTGFLTADKTKLGLVTKANLKLNSDDSGNNFNFDKAYVFSEGNFGKIEFGNNVAVNQKMKVNAARIAKAAGGIGGRYVEHINFPIASDNSANLKFPHFIFLAQSPIGHGGYAKGFYDRNSDNNYGNNQLNYFNKKRMRTIRDGSIDGVEDATKISYYTPKIENFQLGLSYAPNGNLQGVVAKNRDSQIPNLRNITSFGLSYQNDFDNLGVAFSTTAERAQSFDKNRHDLFAYDLGALVSYFGFDLTASYGSWGRSLQPNSGIYSCDYDSNLTIAAQNCSGNNKNFSSAYYTTFGISYELGPISSSITSLKSNFQNNHYQAISWGVEYKMRKNFIPYIEYTNFLFKPNQPKSLNNSYQIVSNKGYVFLTGFLLSF